MSEKPAEQSKYSKYCYSLPRPKKLIAVLVSELLATLFLQYFGCLSWLAGNSDMRKAIAWALTTGHMVQVFGPISGAHINPCVSLAYVILGKMSIVLCMLYITMQFTGAILGFLILKGTLPKPTFTSSSGVVTDTESICCTMPVNGVTEWGAFGIEFFGTAFLVYIMCCKSDPCNRFFKDSIAVKIAVCVFIVILCTVSLTGAGLNPARSFAPAVINGVWVSHWVYWTAPLLAGLITSVLYRLIFLRQTLTDKKPQPPSLQDLLDKMKGA